MFSGHGLEVRRGGIGPRQQIIDLGVEMAGGDAAEHVREISLRIHPAQFAGLDQRGNDRPMLAAALRSGFMMLFHFLVSVIGIEAGRGSDGAQAPFPLP
jgi:hypothetical protein